jgi:hypothetical protein
MENREDLDETTIICEGGRCYALDPVTKRRRLGNGSLTDQIEEDLLSIELGAA